jgi:hypothetical protein
MIEKQMLDPVDVGFKAFISTKSENDVRTDAIAIGLYMLSLWDNRQRSNPIKNIDFETEFIPALFGSLSWTKDRPVANEDLSIETILNTYRNLAKH